MGHCKGGPHMSAELKDMPLTKDMTGGRPSCIINAGVRSRIGGQPQMGHSPAEMGHSPAQMAKPDYLDIDGDDNTKESMKQAAKDKKDKK